jgi:hypothetical protein
MQPDDQIAEWLVRWEEAQEANQPPPAVEELPADLRPGGLAGLRLLRGFARLSHGLATAALPGVVPQVPADTPRYRFVEFWAGAAWARCGAAGTPCWRGRWP